MIGNVVGKTDNPPRRIGDSGKIAAAVSKYSDVAVAVGNGSNLTVGKGIHLPIFVGESEGSVRIFDKSRAVAGSSRVHAIYKRVVLMPPVTLADQHRSEERRVGKECRSRWSP